MRLFPVKLNSIGNAGKVHNIAKNNTRPSANSVNNNSNNFGLYSADMKLIAFKGSETQEAELDKNEYKKKLQALTNDDGSPRFYCYDDIAGILSHLTPENEQYLQTLLDAKDEDEEDYRFEGEIVASIFKILTPENAKYLQTLLDAKDEKEENYRFNGDEIWDILNQIAPENEQYLPILLDAKDEKEEKYRFSGLGIASILSSVTSSEYKQYLPTLLNAKDEKGKYRFDAADTDILYHITPRNVSHFEDILAQKDGSGNLLNSLEISDMLDEIDWSDTSSD